MTQSKWNFLNYIGMRKPFQFRKAIAFFVPEAFQVRFDIKRSVLSILSAASSVLEQIYGTVTSAPSYENLRVDVSSDSNLEKIYSRSIRTLVSLERGRKTKTVFSGQVFNLDRLQADRLYSWMPRLKKKDVWPFREAYNQMLKRAAEEDGAGAIIVDESKFEDAYFVNDGPPLSRGNKSSTNRSPATWRGFANEH